ncbi:hypothetical protein QLQ80_01485 [Mycoplasma sp. M5725]|uniref:Lipoprotein n=1 Tax=Mycoplasma phocimorsus TaxID=3045839 RepID=A0AAJ1UWW4_9MOLU|nr:hypothetical protein [Mycoplasma phocimorsus]MDJ1645760.1 hypothetical protein [Mycoplasma phocimorsus]
MTKSKKILLKLAGFASLGAISAIAVSCGNKTVKPQENVSLDFNGKVKIAIEEAWEKIITNALGKLTPEEQSKIEIVKLENGTAGSYIENNIVKDPAEAADIFPTALDKFDSLVSKGSLFEIKKEDLEQYGENSELVEINGKYWGYPLNVESIFTIYNIEKFPNGIESIDQILTTDPTQTKFAAQFNNMWHGSIFPNTLFSMTDKDVAKQWVGSKLSKASPMLKNPEFKKLMEELYNYNVSLKKSGGALQRIATNNNRDEAIRQGIADGSIQGIIDGPWIVQEVISRIMKTFDADKPKAVEMLKKLRAAKLPTYKNQQLRHFKGGWAFSINKAALLKGNDIKRASNKSRLANKFASLLTSAEFASDWFAQGGKISGAKDAQPKVAAEDMKLQIPGDAKNTLHDMKEWIKVPGFKEAVESFFSGTLSAVGKQAGYNVKQPTWPGGGFWDAWDKNGFSSEFKDFNQFWAKFAEEINLAYIDKKEEEKKPEAEVKPEMKPEAKMDEKKSEEKKPEAEIKPEAKMDEKKPEAEVKPEIKPEAKMDEKKPEIKPEEKKPEAKMDEKKPEMEKATEVKA